MFKPQWTYAILVSAAAGLALLATMNREQLLGVNSLSPVVVSQLQWTHSGSSSWKEIRYEIDRTMTGSDRTAVDARVEHHLENLGNGLVRRTDNWYPRLAGNALIYEERYLLYANLIGLTSRYREPAPIVHAILENIGWFENKLVELAFQPPALQDFDSKWQLRAQVTQLRDQFPAVSNSKAERVSRDIQCVPLRNAVAGKTQRVTVLCESKQSDGWTRKAAYTFLHEAGIFVLSQYDEVNGEESASVNSTIRRLQVDGIPLKF